MSYLDKKSKFSLSGVKAILKDAGANSVDPKAVKVLALKSEYIADECFKRAYSHASRNDTESKYVKLSKDDFPSECISLKGAVSKTDLTAISDPKFKSIMIDGLNQMRKYSENDEYRSKLYSRNMKIDADVIPAFKSAIISITKEISEKSAEMMRHANRKKISKNDVEMALGL